MLPVDKGAIPREYIRTVDVSCFDCKGERQTIRLNKGESVILYKCKNKKNTWEGTIKWDGRRLFEVKVDK